MKIWKLIILVAIFNTSRSQNRRFYHRRNFGGRNNFGNFHRNHQQFPHFHHQNKPQHYAATQQPIITASLCPQIEFLRALDNRWYGNLNYSSVKDQKGVKIEIEFNEPVIGLVNDFSHSTSLDNQLYIISDDSKMLKRGELLHLNFFVNFNELSSLPFITALKINNAQLCSVETMKNECGKLETTSNDTRGTWEGTVTIYSHQYEFGRNIELHFDKDLLALVNNLGDSITNDQKHFTIFNSNHKEHSQPIIINFIAKFDLFKKIPKLQEVYVDNNFLCLSDEDDMNRSNSYSTVSPTFHQAQSNLKLDNLPFHLFPNITTAPKEVHNEKFDCGRSYNSITFRVDNGEIASAGQFPFHAAMFYESFYRCAASLISEKAVLTAAHCVVDGQKEILTIEDFQLLFGTVDLESLTGNENLRKVAKIIKHPDYQDSKILKQDIAIMITNGSLQFSDYVRPICLPKTSSKVTDIINKDVTVLGFGSTSESSDPSRFLHYGQMTVISREQCTENIIFALLPEESTFCAKSKDGFLCAGDSGSATIETINGTYYLRGIASVTVTGANRKCSVENPVGFTDFNAFMSWIKENISE